MTHDDIVDGEAMSAVEGDLERRVEQKFVRRIADDLRRIAAELLLANDLNPFDAEELGDGIDVSHLGAGDALDALLDALQSDEADEEDRRAEQEVCFQDYQSAFEANRQHPNLRNAAALVATWNDFADVMGLDRV